MHFLIKYFTICVIAFLFIVTSTKGQKQAENKMFVTSKVDSCFDKNKLPGILVFYCDGVVTEMYTKGFANVTTQKLFDKNTIFEAGSITKTFTAYILQSILFNKNISDTSSILPYLPDSLQNNTTLQHITFLSLLNHTSGLPRLPTNFDLQIDDMQPYKNYDLPKLYAYLKTANVPVVKTSNYSNLGNALAGVLATTISKKPFAVLMEQFIYKPFKMQNVETNILKNNNKSEGYFEKNTVAPYWDMNVMYPAGGLKTTPTQMFTYLTNLSNPEKGEAENLVNTLLAQSVTINSKIKVARAWHTFEQPEKPVIYWHNGGTYGFSTFVGFIKGTNKKVLVVINKFSANTTADFLGLSIMKQLM